MVELENPGAEDLRQQPGGWKQALLEGPLGQIQVPSANTSKNSQSLVSKTSLVNLKSIQLNGRLSRKLTAV